MKPILLYLLQVIISSGLLYAYYHFFLRNKKFHQYNRFYLLFAATFSMIIPFFNIPVYFSQHEHATWQNALYAITGKEVLIRANASPDFFTWPNILITVYTLAFGILLCRFLLSLLKIKRIVHNNPVENIDDIRFINTEEPGTPFSFFKWLFWNKKIQLDSDQGQQIFRHELFHIRHRHSLDIVFTELLTMLFWINPFYYIIKKELKAIHEFLADQYATETIDKWDYAELLLMQALQTKHSLVNPFFHTQIKRRITMITSSNQAKYRYLRKVLVLPLLAAVAGLFAFSYKKVQNEMPSPKEIRQSIADTIPGAGNPILIVADSLKIVKGEKVTLTEIKKKDLPLYVLNGKVIGKGTTDILNFLQPNSIKSISVLKSPESTLQYGKDGANGVIEIIADTITIHEVQLENAPAQSQKPVVVTGFPARIALKEVPVNSNGLQEVVVTGYKLDNKVFEKLDEEARFPGGNEVWIKYLQRNLNGSIASDRGAPPGNYQVMAQFIVHTDGSISNITALTNHGYGMEEEVMRIIKAGPKWEPGKQNGHTVASYRRQPVTFQVVAEDFPNKDQIDAVNAQMIDAIRSAPKAIYPNPTSGEAVIPYESKSAVSGEIIISDIKGNILSRRDVGLKPGKNTLKVNVGSLSSGNYIISVAEKGSKTIKGYKLVKQ